MSARRIVIGCSVVTVVTLAVLIIGGIATFRHLTATVPIPSAARLAEADTLGLAVVRLEPDDPWIKGTFSEISKYSTRESKPADMFPLELAWAARRSSPASEGHLLSLSLSRSGRLVGLMGDFALWKASSAQSEKFKRVEHHGEGITSFSASPLKGHVFIRNNSIYWSTDLETAKAGVDLAVAAEQAAAAGPASPISQPILGIYPADRPHTVAGAMLNENGSLARILALLPGDALDVPAERYTPVASLAFVFDTSSTTEGAGEVTLKLAEGTTAEEARSIAEDLAGRLPLLKLSKVTFEAVPRMETDRAVIAVKATGLDSLRGPLIEEMATSIKRLEKLQKEGRIDEPDPNQPPSDPNQSSSTFQ